LLALGLHDFSGAFHDKVGLAAFEFIKHLPAVFCPGFQVLLILLRQKYELLL
jgi:hypothetical protein